MSVALYPGSFDPIHNGHLAIIENAVQVFDRLVVAVGYNAAKPSGAFGIDQRMEMIRESVQDLPSVSVVSFTGLVTVAAHEHGATCLVKGIRSATDLDAEMLQANMNSVTGNGIPTVFLPGIGDSALVSSRYVREISAAGGNVGAVVPQSVMRRLSERGQ